MNILESHRGQQQRRLLIHLVRLLRRPSILPELRKRRRKKNTWDKNHQSIVSYYIVTRTSNRKGKAPDDPISCGRFHDGPQTFPSIRTTNNYLYIFCFLCKNMRHTTMPDTPRGAIRINNNHTLYGLRVCLWGIVSSLAHFPVRKWKWRFFFTQNSQYPKGVKLFSWLFLLISKLCLFFAASRRCSRR